MLPREQEQYSMHLRDGRYREAVEALQNLVDEGDQRPFVLTSLAKAYQGVDDAARAAEIMKGYVKKYPDDPEAFQFLSDLYAKAQMPDEMTDALASKFAINPEKDDFLRLAALYNTFGRYDEERRLLVSSFRKSNFLDIPHLLRLGELSAAAGEYPIAIKVLRQLDRQLAPEQQRGRILLFDLLLASKKTEEAISCATNWIRAWPQPWIGMRFLNTLTLTGATKAQIQLLAYSMNLAYPDMTSPISRLLRVNGHTSIARNLLGLQTLQTRFSKSKMPDYEVSKALLEAADILDDTNLIWDTFANSLAKPEAAAAQAIFADAISTHFGVDAIVPFLDRMSNKALTMKPFLSARLATRFRQHSLASRILTAIAPNELSLTEQKTLTLLKANVLN